MDGHTPHRYRHGWIPVDGTPAAHSSASELAARVHGHTGARAVTDAEKEQVNSIVDGVKLRRVGGDADASHYLSSIAPKLPPTQRDAVNRYTGDGFYDLNRKLRAGDTSDPEVARLDAAFRPLPDDVILTRTVGPEAFGLKPADLARVESLKGSIVADPAYQSTALGSPYAGGLGGVTLKIIAPKGTPAIPASAISNNPHEREVILGRGQRLAIAKVTRNSRYGYDITAVALPPEKETAAA